ncbi:MAG TPA: hypothetical protein VHD60_00315 [Candidatus Saccharimonadales bacterium]|nr:hypothetical protein [Candidatus Saccharimonadales bacterium]
MSKLKRFICIALSSALILVFGAPLSAVAASSNTNGSGNVSNGSVSAVTVGYGSDSPLQYGLIVGLKPGDASKVVALSADRIKDMHGVVVPSTDATVTLSDGSAKSGQVYVATVGRYNVLVSTQNGPIHTGDYITISSLSGIGMKADQSEPVVLGKAAANFDGTGNVQGSATLKDVNGNNVAISLGRIPVDLGIDHNPLAGATSGVPGFLQNAAHIFTDQPVSTWRLYLALTLFIVAAIIAGSLLYGGVRSSMVAIGRNPLAKNRIMVNLFRVTLLSLTIFIIGVGAVYLVLKV